MWSRKILRLSTNDWHTLPKTNRQEAQVSPREPRDALYQLKYWPTVVQITQTDRVSAWGALSATVTFLANMNSCSRRSLNAIAVRLSPVTFVHPTQPVKIFGNFSTPFGTLAVRWHPWKILRRSSQRNPSVGGFKRKRVSKYSDFWHLEGYNSETMQDRR